MLTIPTHQQAYNNGMAVLGLAVERPWLALGGPFLFLAFMGLDTILVALFPTQLAVTCSIFYSYVGEGQVSFIT